MYDSYNRNINYLRISVTDRCNLRCVYCMPHELSAPIIAAHEHLSVSEISDIVATGTTLGFTKIRLTGGEPLMRADIIDIVRSIAATNGVEDFGMTTNGQLLMRYAAALRAAGLKRLNVSLDALDPERYRMITQGGDVTRVLRGIEAAMAAGFPPVKINCVIHHSPDEPDAAAVRDYAGRYHFAVRFIRQMDLEAGEFWPIEGGDGGRCHLCNRVRISARGEVHPCLFSDSSYNMRDMGIYQALSVAVQCKPARGQVHQGGRFYAIGG